MAYTMTFLWYRLFLYQNENILRQCWITNIHSHIFSITYTPFIKNMSVKSLLRIGAYIPIWTFFLTQCKNLKYVVGHGVFRTKVNIKGLQRQFFLHLALPTFLSSAPRQAIATRIPLFQTGYWDSDTIYLSVKNRP